MKSGFPLLLIISAFTLVTSCANSPEEAAVKCVQALCEGDEQALRSVVTEDSFLLYQGLKEVVPHVVNCRVEEVSVASSRVVDDEGSTVRVALAGVTGGLESLMVHRRQGTWRVDFFMIGWDDTMGLSQALSPGGGGQ